MRRKWRVVIGFGEDLNKEIEGNHKDCYRVIAVGEKLFITLNFFDILKVKREFRKKMRTCIIRRPLKEDQIA